MVENAITLFTILRTQMTKADVDENCSSTWDIPPPLGWAPALIPPCPSPPRLDRSEHNGDEDNDYCYDVGDSDPGGTAGGDKEVTIWSK